MLAHASTSPEPSSLAKGASKCTVTPASPSQIMGISGARFRLEAPITKRPSRLYLTFVYVYGFLKKKRAGDLSRQWFLAKALIVN